MRLGTKIFFSITVFFSVAFLLGGYVLLSYFYEVTMEREISSAVEGYQYNKFVMQANLITRGEDWFKGAVAGTYDMRDVVSDMHDTVAVFSMEQKMLFSGFPEEAGLADLLGDVRRGRVDYRFVRLNGRIYLMTAGIVEHGQAGIYLVTGADVQRILEQQEKMIGKFGTVYGVTMAVGTVLIYGMSMMLTRPVKILINATEKIADGNYEERVADMGRDEVGQLAENFNKMARAVEEKVQELSESARQKEDFVANFAHELKTPLTSVIGYADRIYQKELPREEQRQAAWHIWNEGMRLEALSLKLMDLASLHHGEFVLQEVAADILFRELAADMEYIMEKHGVELVCEAQPAYIKVEYDLFKTLILNLTDNAVKAGARHIRITGRVRQEKTGEGKDGQGVVRMWYQINVQDDGRGIPEEEIGRITEAFYMVDKSRSRKQHGVGLGLALAEKIALLHGGRLSFESDGHSGTSVYIKLQCRRDGAV